MSVCADVEIGLERTSYTTEEDGVTVEVCARVTRGTLERQVLVDLSMADDTAVSKSLLQPPNSLQLSCKDHNDDSFYIKKYIVGGLEFSRAHNEAILVRKLPGMYEKIQIQLIKNCFSSICHYINT